MKKQNFSAKFFTITSFILVILLSTLTIFAAGEVDAGFNPGLIFQRDSPMHQSPTIKKIIIQPDNKVIAIGRFRGVDKYVRDGIVRFNADGTVDTTFTPPLFADTFLLNSEGNVRAVELQPDGKILVGLVQDLNVNGVVRKGIARLNPDGSLDPTFNFSDELDVTVRDIEVSADNKIIFAFSYILAGSGERRDIARLLPDGQTDPTFDTQKTFSSSFIGKIKLLPDDKIIVSDGFGTVGQPFTARLRRLNADGSLDGSFSSSTFSNLSDSALINSIAIQPDGKLLVGGDFETVNGFGVPTDLIRFNADGTYDASFNSGNSGASPGVSDIEILSDGRILIGGIASYNNIAKQRLGLLNSDGSLIESFNYIGGLTQVFDLDMQTDGKIVIGSRWDSGNNAIIRLNPDATVDESFQPAIGEIGQGRKVFVQSDGKILVGGVYSSVNGASRFNIVRLNPDGSIDEEFISPDLDASGIFAIDVRADGKIVLGRSGGVSILNSNGTLVASSISGGYSTDVKFIPGSADILAVGNLFLRKLNSNTGQIDFSFNVPTNAFINKIALQPDGKILVAGDFTTIKGVAKTRIARLNADGTIDNTFNAPGGANSAIYDLLLQSDGKILIGGQFTGVNFDTSRKYLARLNSDGSLDTGFSPEVNNTVTSLKIQPNGKILIGGAMTSVGGIMRKSIARLNQNGSIDPGFNLPLGTDGNIWSIDLQSDNNIIIGGEFKYVNGLERLGVARLFNSGTRTLFDFDGDSRTDISIFRPTAGEWWYLRSSDGSNRAFGFGSSTDKIVPADFTGDGKTDVAIWRPSTGEWFVMRSEDNSFYSFPFGTTGDIPVAADFDGDGFDNPAVFRSSTATWYILNSDGGATITTFGASGDIPAIADYDGDGKADLAIYRPASGEWWINRSQSQTTVVYNFGVSTDKAVPADYTGDGKADVAFFRPLTGEWFILRSEDSSFYSFPFGTSGDIPTPGDYDGDGTADPAVFRPSSVTWYLLQSTNGFAAATFGATGDQPVPSAFIP